MEKKTNFLEVIGIIIMNISIFLILYSIIIYFLIIHVIILSNADNDYLLDFLPLLIPSIILLISFAWNYSSGNFLKNPRKKWVFGLSFILLSTFAYYEIFVEKLVERFF